ncbi:MAG: chemotaxis protein CheW [Phenylobacterium sp.]|nr:chemotaxis protein CheW [Phenylobacterium sp.]
MRELVFLASMAPTSPFVLFQVADSLLAIPQRYVAEVLPLPDLEPPPGAPPVLAGFLNLGGSPLPVIDAARLFDPEAEPTTALYAHILRVVPEAAATFGLLVAQVTDVAVSSEGEAALSEADSLGGVLRANLMFGGRIAAHLDVDRLLLREEALRVEALGAVAQARLAGWSEEVT